MLWAPNETFDQWRDTPASYADIRRALHYILHGLLNYDMHTAVSFNLHSFRHFLVESGQQLRALGICSPEDIERLGNWAHGSAMPQAYDNAGGVSELQARYIVIGALRTGWTPAAEGDLPSRPPRQLESAAGQDVVHFVTHKATKKRHRVKAGERVTICRFWTCG